MSDITCPYCNYEQDICQDDGAHCGEGFEDCDCVECGKTFRVETTITFDFEARCTEDEHEWVKGTNVHGDTKTARKFKYVGEIYYWIRCSRESCPEYRHLKKELWDAHPAGEKKE